MGESEEIVLCLLEDIEDPGSRELSWGEGAWPLQFFAVRDGDAVFGYVNRCPHRGHPLNWQVDRFLSRERDLIVCNSHGARFRITDGVCIAGPCPGARLDPVALRVRDGRVVARARDLREIKRPAGV